MKISESIEAHLSAAVATISQRNQATLPEFHKIFLFSVFYRLYRLAKAFGFCLYFYTQHRRTGFGHFAMSNLIGLLPFIQAKEIPAGVYPGYRAWAGMTMKRAGLIHKFNTTAMRIV